MANGRHKFLKYLELLKDDDDKYIDETIDLPDKLILSDWVSLNSAITRSLTSTSLVGPN